MDKHFRPKIYYRGARKKKKPELFRRARKYLLGVFLLFFAVWAAYSFLNSGFFSLEKIEITGLARLSEEEVLQALQLTLGENILKIKISQLEERLLNLPRVAGANVTRHLPRELHVVIIENELLGLIPYQDYFLEVGENGLILDSATAVQDYDLPLITGLQPVAGTVGEAVWEGRLLEGVRDLCSALKEEKLLVSEINVEDPENFVIVTMDGLVVWLGNENFAEKTHILVQIIGRLKDRQEEGYLDLRVSSAPAFHITE